MPFVSVDDASLYYEIWGQGNPLLLIHGFMGTGATEFPHLRAKLSQHYQVITPDLRGYGQSTPKPRRYGPDFYHRDARDMVVLLAHLGLSEVIVMGYSDGGEVALWLPLLAPQRIGAVVTWGATGHFSASIKPSVLGMMNMQWRTPTLDALHGAEHIAKMTARWVQAMTSIINAGGDITFSQAARIRVPVLMMLGDGDDLNPVTHGQAMAQALPNGDFRVFEGCGHAIHECQAEAFWHTVLGFLQGLG